MKIGKLGYLSFSMMLAGVLACGSDDGGGGGDDDGAGDDGGGDDDGSGSDDDGTEPDAGGGADAPDSACLGTPVEVTNEGWDHVPETAGTEYIAEPPASGTHYPVWAMWGVHGDLARGYWVHNVEHGGIVLLHGPDASKEVVDELNQAFEAIPEDPECGHRRTVLAADPLLTTAVAVVAADWVMDGDCVDEAAILAFVEAHRAQSPPAPEDLCTEGTIPP